MPLDSVDIVSDKVTAMQNILSQLYRLRDEGKNLDSTIELLEAQMWEAIEVRALEVKADQSAESQ